MATSKNECTCGAEWVDETEALARLRAAIAEAGGVRPFARRHHVSPAYVSRAATGHERIGAGLAEPLGLEPARGFWAR